MFRPTVSLSVHPSRLTQAGLTAVILPDREVMTFNTGDRLHIRSLSRMRLRT